MFKSPRPIWWREQTLYMNTSLTVTHRVTVVLAFTLEGRKTLHKQLDTHHIISRE